MSLIAHRRTKESIPRKMLDRVGGYLFENPFPSDQRLSDCENDFPKGAALYEVTQSISRICQREVFSNDRRALTNRRFQAPRFGNRPKQQSCTSSSASILR
jgi:hypothetical protein